MPAPSISAKLRFSEPRLRRSPLHTTRYYEDAPLGAIYASWQTTFRVFAPTAERLWVVLADDVDGPATLEHLLVKRSTGVWEGTIAGDLAGKCYAFRLEGPGLDPSEEVPDIYAVCAQGRCPRALIVDLGLTDPAGFRESAYRFQGSPADAIIYEMHIRDLTLAASSGVEHKCKYLGLTESSAHFPGRREIRTGLNHLRELGVTHVQLMPVQDFDNDEAQGDYDWGYMPVQFNSPDGVYAGSVAGPGRITELKTAIQALHRSGIGVVLDVVYNHTSSRAGFERLVPGYYFRMTGGGRFGNGSGCGNELHTAVPMARKFILDSLRHWVTEYQVDGFRFDLMGLMDLETLQHIRDELRRLRPDLLLYGEPWAAGKTLLSPVTDKSRIAGSGVAAFNDCFRDALRGDCDGTIPGFVQGAGGGAAVGRGLAGAVDDWSQDPVDAVNFFECHDNLTMWDKLARSARLAPGATVDKSASREVESKELSTQATKSELETEVKKDELVTPVDEATRKRMLKLATLALLTAQGTPLLHAGQEFCRSKGGDANSYASGDRINQIDWTLKMRHADVFEYTRGLIALRKAHPVLRLRTRKEIHARISIATAGQGSFVAYRLTGRDLAGESAHELLVLLNGAAEASEYRLPRGRWNVYADAEKASLEPLGQLEGRTVLAAHSGLLLIR